MTSILESEYIPQDRPYSQEELRDNREKLYKSLRLGINKAWHSRCKHFYYVRQNGRKEKDILASENSDSGNCSVCWKIHKCGRDGKQRAINMVDQYSNAFYEDPTYISYDLVDMESLFYRWLYDDEGNQNMQDGDQTRERSKVRRRQKD